MNQLKSIYNRSFKDSHSHPIHKCFPIIASNGTDKFHITMFNVNVLFMYPIIFIILSISILFLLLLSFLFILQLLAV